MKTNKQPFNRYQKVLLGVILILFTFIFWPRTKVIEGVKNGYITLNNESSDLIDALFYLDKKNNLYVDLTKLDGCTSADIIKSQGSFIISTIKNQITILPKESTYYHNLNKITEDSSYLKPIYINGYPYADFKTIFRMLGYDMSFESNYDNTTLKVTLKESKSFKDMDYTVIKATIKETKLETISQTEAVVNEKSNEKTELPVVPEPTEIDRTNWPEQSHETIAPNNEIKENTEFPSKESEETIIAKTEEELEIEKKKEIWETEKKELTNLFVQSQPNFGQEAFSVLGDYGICFNQASGGTYGNTVTVLNNTSDGFFMTVSLSADWSDQAENVITPQSKAFYSGLEHVYKKTIMTVLGEKEGSEFFTYLKKHADETQTGGYISQYDKDGVIQSVWTDHEVGDGLGASTLELSEWIHRYTDDGLQYDIVRNGDGIKIIIF